MLSNSRAIVIIRHYCFSILLAETVEKNQFVPRFRVPIIHKIP